MSQSVAELWDSVPPATQLMLVTIVSMSVVLCETNLLWFRRVVFFHCWPHFLSILFDVLVTIFKGFFVLGPLTIEFFFELLLLAQFSSLFERYTIGEKLAGQFPFPLQDLFSPQNRPERPESVLLNSLRHITFFVLHMTVLLFLHGTLWLTGLLLQQDTILPLSSLSSCFVAAYCFSPSRGSGEHLQLPIVRSRIRSTSFPFALMGFRLLMGLSILPVALGYIAVAPFLLVTEWRRL